MPNNKPTTYLIRGCQSQLYAAQIELDRSKAHQRPPVTKQPDTIYLNVQNKQYWHTLWNLGPEGETVLTLPQDWDQLMAILDSLKQPPLPDYVRYCHRYESKVGRVISKFTSNGTSLYNVLDTYGKELDWAEPKCVPITEEEFIQGGLKELEEAGFVVGAQVKGPGEHSSTFTTPGLWYKTDSTKVWPMSEAVRQEIARVGFCFSLPTGGCGSIPVGQCTLLPKALPTTSHGIPYLLDRDNLYLGPNPDTFNPDLTITLKASMLRYMMKQGLTGIVTKIGPLVLDDLTKVLSV